MAVFDWVESPSTSSSPKPIVKSTMFGDGYSQDAPDGLNPLRQVWNVVFDSIDQSTADDIEAFLLVGMGTTRFDWTPPRQSVALKFKCTSYNRTIGNEIDVDTITATFEQVFEP